MGSRGLDSTVEKKRKKRGIERIFNPRADTYPWLCFPGPPIFPCLPRTPTGLVKTDRKRGFSVAIETQSWFVLSVESAPLSPLKIERNFSLRFDSRLVIDLSPNFPIFRSKSYLVFPPFAISRAFKIHLFFFSF